MLADLSKLNRRWWASWHPICCTRWLPVTVFPTTKCRLDKVCIGTMQLKKITKYNNAYTLLWSTIRKGSQMFHVCTVFFTTLHSLLKFLYKINVRKLLNILIGSPQGCSGPSCAQLLLLHCSGLSKARTALLSAVQVSCSTEFHLQAMAIS